LYPNGVAKYKTREMGRYKNKNTFDEKTIFVSFSLNITN
jgi:hypothetical protein